MITHTKSIHKQTRINKGQRKNTTHTTINDPFHDLNKFNIFTANKQESIKGYQKHNTGTKEINKTSD